MLYLQGYNRMTRFVLTVAVWLIAIVAFAQAEADGQLYAVLISGGRNRLTNHERYWNDCALLYRTLRHTYHVPQRNIIVLMSDGGDPAEDMIRADGMGFVSSPVDLDGDGAADVSGAATMDEVERTFFGLAQRMGRSDRLLVFIVDHGDSDDFVHDSYLWLWNNERLSDFSLDLLLGVADVCPVCIVMGQCYSGGFVAELQRDGRIVATACSGSERSWACNDRPYDEFIYHWTCAVGGVDEDGNATDADADDDGFVSMQEAFDYARSHDRRQETPQYASWPETLGQHFTLGRLTDTGITPAHAATTPEGGCYTLSGQRLREPPARGLYILNAGKKQIVR